MQFRVISRCENAKTWQQLTGSDQLHWLRMRDQGQSSQEISNSIKNHLEPFGVMKAALIKLRKLRPPVRIEDISRRVAAFKYKIWLWSTERWEEGAEIIFPYLPDSRIDTQATFTLKAPRLAATPISQSEQFAVTWNWTSHASVPVSSPEYPKYISSMVNAARVKHLLSIGGDLRQSFSCEAWLSLLKEFDGSANPPVLVISRWWTDRCDDAVSQMSSGFKPLVNGVETIRIVCDALLHGSGPLAGNERQREAFKALFISSDEDDEHVVDTCAFSQAPAVRQSSAWTRALVTVSCVACAMR